jgi:hypothetical protein
VRFAKRLLFDLPTLISATLMLTCIAVRARAIWRVDYGIYSRSVATPDRFGFRTVTMQSSRQGVLLEVADFESFNRAEIDRFALAYALVPRWQHGSEPTDNAKRIIGVRSTLPPDWSWLERLGARYERRAAVARQTLVVGAAWWPLLIATSVLPVGRLYVTLRRVGRRRMCERLGLCVACGYDLQATPERCPECGTVPKRVDAPT